MDFYIIELKDRLKIGVSKSTDKRITNILSTGGHGEKDVLNLFNFPKTGLLEAPLKRLFRPYIVGQSKYNRGEEWFYKKGLVDVFINEIKKGTKPSKDLIDLIQYKFEPMEIELKKNAIFIFESIKKERKGIGYPNTISFETFIEKNKMQYKNMTYWVNNDFTHFTREPKFQIENISDSQEIECLQIIKNNTKNLKKKAILQGYIDDVYNKVEESYMKRLEINFNYFFNSIEIQEVKNPNLRILYDNVNNHYYFKKKYSNLTTEELVLIIHSKYIILYSNEIIIDYEESHCICKFEDNDLIRVRNLLKKSEYIDKTLKDNNDIIKLAIALKKYIQLKRNTNENT